MNYFSSIILNTSATLQACAKAPFGRNGALESYNSDILPIIPSLSKNTLSNAKTSAFGKNSPYKVIEKYKNNDLNIILIFIVIHLTFSIVLMKYAKAREFYG